MKIQYKMTQRGHWWFDAGLVGLYQIAHELIGRQEEGLSEQKIWPEVNVLLESDGVILDAPAEKMTPFLEACYEELASRWWNRSTEKQEKDYELVFYDREKDELKCLPKRMPTPIPALSVSATSWRVEGDRFEELPQSLQERVTGFLEENKKKLWGSKKLLCYGLPACHPKIPIFPEAGRGGGKVCSICGQISVCDNVSQTSFPLFSSLSATFSFNPTLGSPDSICWECQLLGKFAVEAAFYKKAGEDFTYILQFSSGDLKSLRRAHEVFGSGSSSMRIQLNDVKKIYFSNFVDDKTVLQYAGLPYELLWGFYLKAYDLLQRNRKDRMELQKELKNDEDDFDAESLKNVSALNVILLSLASKGNTFITKEVISYTDTTYLFRLISYLKKCLRAEMKINETFHKDGARFFEFLFLDFLLPNPQKPYDPLNGMIRNRILQRVFEKKSILQQVEKFVFERSMSEYPWLGRIVFFLTCYELVANHRDTKEGEGRGMNKEQIEIAKKLGSQIVLSAKETLLEDGESVDAMKSVKGDLFTLRKTRTVKDFLERLNRLQFRYGIVVNKEIASGILAEEDVPFEDFKAYCMISALNAYNNVMRPRKSQESSEN